MIFSSFVISILLFLVFWISNSIGQKTPDCVVNNADGSYYPFTQSGQVSYNFGNDTANDDTWTFFLEFCLRVDNVINPPQPGQPQTTWEGWNMGFLTQFAKVDGKEFEFYQLYENGDKGYPCRDGLNRQTEVIIYCGDCPINTTCINGTSQFCLCSVSYSDQGPNRCSAILTVAADCPVLVRPTPTPPINPKSTLTGGQIFGIVLLVFVVVMSVGCATGYVYNYKVYDRRGKLAIPGYRFFNRESEGRTKFSGSTYQHTTSDHQYGTL